MFPLVQKQAQAAQGSVEQARLALQAQSNPLLAIKVESVTAETIQPNPNRPPQGESLQQWELMKHRRVTINFTVQNYNAGRALSQVSSFSFQNGVSTLVSLPTSDSACFSQVATIPLAPLEKGDEVKVRKSVDPYELLYTDNAVIAVGCVAYKSTLDSTIHKNAVLVQIRVGPNEPGVKAPVTSYGVIALQ